MNKSDIVIVGAGIVGLSLARELLKRHPDQKIVILEKEERLGKHSSGRNSGVLHSGIYYPKGSLKAKVCAQGARELAEYCEEYGLPLKKVGKVIVPLKEDDDKQLDMLYDRAISSGANVKLIDNNELKEIEPQAYSLLGKALYSPDTAVFDPIVVLDHIASDIRSRGVTILFNQKIGVINPEKAELEVNGQKCYFGFLINAAGLHADKVAKAFGVGNNYSILPFKGIYYILSESSGLKINGHIYPVPDIRVPFLGVHFTKSIKGGVYLGPTAVPAFGRENYHGMEDVNFSDASQITVRLLQQYIINKQGFRRLVHQEGMRFFKANFAKAAKALVPGIKEEYLISSSKVGIRPQLLDIRKKELVMDFLVEKGKRSIHVLNAISPAFTSAFSFSRYVLDNYFLHR